MYKIKSVVGREILDSRGNPTVGVEIELDGGMKFILPLEQNKVKKAA